MIKKLNESHISEIISYLKKEEGYNNIIASDIKRCGLENYSFHVWANIDDNGNIRGLLIKYLDLLTIYSKDNYNIEDFIEYINEISYSNINAKLDTLKEIEQYIPYNRKRIVDFCILKNCNYLKDYKIDYNVKKIRIGKLNKILKLYEHIDEFETPTIKSIKNDLKNGRGYYIEKNRKVVSMAQSTSECEYYAMVVGVGTHPEFRKQGYATKCMVKLCESLIKDKKIPCLFYDNEKAGKIYKKIGFENINKWVIYYK